MEERNKIYFLSDFHLGIPDRESSLEREKKIVEFLDQASKDASEIYILGDIFDFWFEYKTAVPRGYVRLLGKIATLSDSGIPIHIFIGNHDMWIFDYLPTELGATLYRDPIRKTYGNKKFLIGHGDGLGPGDHGYKFIKSVFRNPISQWLFARFHPNFGIGMANFWSGRSRKKHWENDRKWTGDENEFLVQYCKQELKKEQIDFFIFGHRHLPINMQIDPDSRYINLGDWINYFTYAVFNGETMELRSFQGNISTDLITKSGHVQDRS